METVSKRASNPTGLSEMLTPVDYKLGPPRARAGINEPPLKVVTPLLTFCFTSYLIVARTATNVTKTCKSACGPSSGFHCSSGSVITCTFFFSCFSVILALFAIFRTTMSVGCVSHGRFLYFCIVYRTFYMIYTYPYKCCLLKCSLICMIHVRISCVRGLKVVIVHRAF